MSDSFEADLELRISTIRQVAEQERWYDFETPSIDIFGIPVPVPGNPTAPPPNVPTEDTPGLIDELESRLRTYTEGNPEAFDLLIEALGGGPGVASSSSGRVETELLTALNQDLPQLESRLSGWGGTAGDDFRNVTLGNWRDMSHFQISFLQEIERALRSYRELLVRIRHDVLAIAGDTMDALIEEQVPETSSAFESSRFTILGALASAARAPTHVGVTISLLSAIDSEFTSAPDSSEGNVERTVGGSHRDEILRSALSALDQLDDATRQEEDLIRAAIRNDQSQVAGADKYQMRVEEPDLVDYRDGRDLDGYFEPREPLVHPAGGVDVDLVELLEAGQVLVPAMAYQYEHARIILEAVREDSVVAFGESPLFLRSPFVSFCFTLNAALRATRDNLNASGEALVDIARRYGEADGISADELDGTVGDFGDRPLLGENTPLRPYLLEYQMWVEHSDQAPPAPPVRGEPNFTG